MSNEVGKVLRRHKMLHEGLTAVLTAQGLDHPYKIEVIRTVGEFSRVVKEGQINAISNRLAIKKMKRWLDVRFPVKSTVPQVDDKRKQLESLFSSTEKGPNGNHV